MFDTEPSPVPESNDHAYEKVFSEAESIEVPVEPVETPTVPATEAPDPPVETPAPTDAPPAASSPPVPETPADTPADTPTHTPFTFKVDQRDVALTGAYEDGDNIVIPKATWHTEAKNFLADRSQIRQMQSEWQQRERQLTEHQSVRESTASALLADLQRITQLPEAESFEEWEKLRREYPTKVLELQNKHLTDTKSTRETEDRQRYEAQVVEQHVAPRLQEHLKGAIGAEIGTHTEVVGLLAKLPDQAKVKEQLETRIFQALWEDAEAGNLYFRNGQTATLENGVQVPDVVPDVQRIARVVRREVEGMREALDLRAKIAKIESAAKANAEKEAARKTPVPPAISAKGTTVEGVKDKQPTSFADVYDEALQT